jgi:hypothetical protein
MYSITIIQLIMKHVQEGNKGGGRTHMLGMLAVVEKTDAPTNFGTQT